MKKSIALSLIAFCATLAHGQGAPTFASYPANVEKATATAVKLSADQLKLLRSNADGREFNSSLKKSFAAGVSFAGHYMVANWSCGTACGQAGIIDGRTGEVFLPAQLDGFGPQNAGPKAGISYYEWDGKTLVRRFFKKTPAADLWNKADIEYRKDSSLLIMNAQPN